MKRLLTLALSLGFFIWLPSAFADGDGLSLNAPATFRQVQTSHDSHLLTLKVDNIQVREAWQVTSAADFFSIDGGVLKASLNATDTHVVTVFAVDQFKLLNPAYVNLTASAVITVVFESGNTFRLVDEPRLRLSVIVGSGDSLYTFTVTNGADSYNYAVGGAGVGYFDINDPPGDGELVLNAATVGIYTLSVTVEDSDGKTDKAVVIVDVRPRLSLAMVPRLTAFAGKPEVLHIITAGGGIGEYVYKFDDGVFRVNDEEGDFVVRPNATPETYTLAVLVEDKDEPKNEATVLVTVVVLPGVALKGGQIPDALAHGQEATIFVASGGIGPPYTYELVDGDGSDNFDLGTGGTLSVKIVAEAGTYTLIVAVEDTRDNRATARVTLEIAGELTLHTTLLAAVARLTMTVHTFEASGGVGAKRYTLISQTSQPKYFSVNAESGELVLAGDKDLKAGQYILVLKVSDDHEQITVTVTVSVAKNAIFVLGGRSDGAYKNDVWWSVDGNSWRLVVTGVAWTPRSEHQVAGYGARLYVSGGENNIEIKTELMYSLNGKDWLDDGGLGWQTRTQHQVVEHQGSLYILGGKTGGIGGNNYDDDVRARGDGGWQLRTSSAGWTAKEGYQVVSHHGRLYKLGGTDGSAPSNNVWSSADGTTWILEGTADWGGRYNHQAVSHQGRIYVLGGLGGNNNYLDDVWSSADGRIWRSESSPAWLARDSYQAVSYGGMLYVLGGNDSNGLKNDVWSSANGKSWNLVPGGAGWSARDGLQAVVFPPPLVLLGASEKINMVAGTEAALHTLIARYGFGDNYTYELGSNSDGFSIKNGNVLSMDSDLIAGLYTVIVWVTDAEGTRAQTAIIIELFNFNLADAPMKLDAYAGSSEEVELHTFAAVYGDGAYTYTLVNEPQPGTFAVGKASGILSVLPNAGAGVYTVSVEVEDGGGNSATAVATVELSENLSLADAQRLSVVAGKALSLHIFNAVGGASTPTYDLLNHKDYFTVDGDSGILSVQAASEVGVYTLSVEASDGEGSQATARAIVDVLPRLLLANASLLIAVEKKAVSLHMFSASGGIGGKTYTFVAVAGDDTQYFSLNITSGVLSLRADANAGKYTLTVEVKDERDNRDKAVATVNISTALSLADAGLLRAAVSVANNDLHTFAASGGLGAKTYTLAAVAVNFMVDSASGVLSVDDQTALTTYIVSVQVTDASGDTAVAVATVKMVDLLLESALNLSAIVGRTVTLHTFEAVGGVEPNTYSIMAGNEDYFTLVADNGMLLAKGSATVGIYTLTVAVRDAVDNEAEAMAVVVVASSLSLAGVSYDDRVQAFSKVTVGVYTFIASGGIGAKTYTLVSGATDGLAVDAASGVLSVVNAQSGIYQAMVKVSDSRGNTAEAEGYVEVKDRLLLTEVPLLENFARLSVTVILHTLVDSGGEGTKRYTMIDDKSGYFTVGADNGELSLPPNPVMPAGAYTLLVEVSDGGSPIQRATAAVTVQLASNGIFVLGGQVAGNTNVNDVWSSVDGETWKEQADAGWAQRRYHQAVAHNGRLYVLGGRGNSSSDRKNDVWYSVDGENWTLVTDTADWEAREKHQAVAHNGRIYVLGGYDGNNRLSDVWSSADGKSWDPVTGAADWSIREDHQAVVHNGRIYVLGGFDGGDVYNDVWSSVDGNTWIFEGNAAWDIRYIHQAVSHAGRLYVLGGTGVGEYNDVWSSVDGRSWVREQANNSNFWSQRSGHQSLSRDGLLYVLGGNVGSNNRMNDVWSSADGVEWTETPNKADWSERQRHQAVVFPSPLVLVGTSETITLTARVDAGAIHTFIAQHGLGDPAYSLAPEGLGFSIGDDGVLSANNLSQTGLYVLTVRVEDQEGAKAESVVNLEVLSFALADAPLIKFLAGLSTTKDLHTFTPVYGVEPYDYNLSGVPQYFSLSNNGVLSAKANVTVGTYILSAEVTDARSNKATAAITVEAVPQVSLADALPLSLVAAKATVLHTFEAEDGIGTHTYNLLNERKSFTVVADSGVLSSRATTAAKTYVLMVEVRDGEGGGSQATALVTVEVRPRLVLTDTERLIAVEQKAKDLHTFTSIGGIGAATYTLTTGNGAEYFALNATSGVLSLSAEAVAGQYTLTVGVKDERANSDEKIVAVNISAALSLLLSDDAKPISNRENQAQDNLYTFEASGGIGIKTYTLVVDVAHFKVNAAGVLAVDADASAGDYTLSVEVSDADGNRASVVATVQLVALYLSDIDSLYAIVGRNMDLHTFDGGDAAQSYIITDGNVGSHFTLDSQSGVLAVQNTAPVGIYTLSVVVEDGSSNRSEAARAVVEVRLSLLLADAPRLTAVAEFAASLHTFVAAHGGDGKAYTIEGGDAGGNFVLNAASGVLSLRAESAAGLYTLTVQAADERDSLVTAVATVEVSAVLRLADALALVADAGDVVSLTTFTASGGIGVKTYTLVAGNEDNYFAINATSGVLSVVSAGAMPKIYTLSVRAIDRHGYRVEARGMVSVRAKLALNMPAAPLRALARLSVEVDLHQFTANNGIGTKQYAIADDEGYFAIDADSGLLSLPANSTMVAGDYILNLVVSDSDVPPQQVTSAVDVRITPNGLFVLGGNDAARKNDVWSLVGGGDWGEDTTAADWTARDKHQAVPYKGRLYVLGGNSGSRQNDVWSSFDGENWTPGTAAGWSARDGHQAVAHNERIYVLGGNTGSRQNDVWSSTDGSSWQKEPAAADWSARDDHQAVSHNGRIYVLGGNDGSSKNDVWSSADGSSWEQETADAGWSVRVGHQAVAHKGRIYVLGGDDGTNRLNDVWSSFDGENWSEETAAAGWAARAYHMARSYQGRLYVSSGKDGDTTLNDIWSSADGKTWQPETSADWAKRFSHEMVVFPQPLVLTSIIGQAELTRGVGGEIHTFAAQHGFPDYSYSLDPDPFGFDIGKNTGVLEADGNADPGEYVFNVRVDDQDGARAETEVKIEVIGFSLADAPRLSVLADSATAVSVYTFVAAYGRAPYTYVLGSGAGSNNFALAVNGVLSVKANTAQGEYILTINANDAFTGTDSAVATVAVVPRVAWGDLPRLSVVAAKVLVLHTLTAMDGLGTYTYNLLTQQEYFTVVATSGVLSSRSTVAVGLYILNVEVRDGAGSQATAQVIVNVRARLALANAPLLTAIEKKAADLHKFATSGGIGVATYTLLAGNAEYFFVAETGELILQTVAVEGTYIVEVRATDERDNQADAVATVVLSAALFMADAPLISAAVRTAADLHMFEASGGVGVKTYDLEAGASYFSVISTSGLLAVNAQAPAGVYSLTVKATDTQNNDVFAVATVVVSRLFLADVLEIYGIENTEEGVYTFDGGADAETYSIVFFGTGAGYFAIDPQSGLLSVQNAQLGTYTLSIAAYNAAGDGVLAKAVVEITMAVSLADVPQVIVVVADAAVSLHTFVASHGVGSKTYAFAAGNAAGHFDLNALSGVLSLRAGAVADIYTLTVRATDEYNNSGDAVAVVDVSAALQMAETPPLTVSVAIGEDKIVTTYVATGGLGAKTYMVVALENFTINGETGALSVVNAPQTGFYTLSVQAVDQRGVTVEVQSTVHVKGELLLADAPMTLHTFARLSVAATLHTFVGIGGLGIKTYEYKDNSRYFNFARVADNIILSLPINNAVVEGTYTVSVVVSDSDVPPQQRTATAEVFIAKNGLVILGGGYDTSNRLNDVWLSADGHTWAEAAAADWTARSKHQAVAHNGRLYVLGGFAGGDKNDVWSSADGRTWVEETAAAEWSARNGHQAVAHNGLLYVLGGSGKNDVWSSADGQNWVEMTAAAGWSARSEHQAVSHNSRLYVLGGASGSNRLRDVWSSADGRTWSRDTAAANWVARDEHQVVSHQGTLYVLGGWSGSGNPYKDVWSSEDGKNWVLEPAADWQQRYGHQVQSYRGSLYLSLGQISANTPINDIWSSADGSDWQRGTVGGWAGRFSHQMAVFPPAMVLFGIGQPVVLNLGASSPELHTYSARYGGGAYTYGMVSDSNVFDFQNRVLKTNSNLAEGRYTLTVMVTDAEGSMDQNVVKIDVQNNFAVVDVPPLYAVADVTAAVGLHTFAAVQGTAPITFTIFSGNEGGHFTLNAESSELFVQNASVAIYTLGVRAEDSRSPTRRRVEVFVVVNVNYPLSLAEAEVTIQTGITAGFYTLSITGGGGVRTLESFFSIEGSAEYFSLNVASGVLQVSNAAVGKHVLVVAISDESTNQDTQANIAVQVVPQMSLMAVPLAAVARLSVNATVHTFVASNGVGKLRYTLIADESGYLTLNADSGVLLLPENPDMLAGTYSLQVVVSDSLPVPQLATAVATLRIVRNGIFMLGGVDTDGNEFDDVWAAADGKIWAKMANADWPVRSNHQAVVYQGRMYVLGGYDGSNLLNDMWSSADGKNWTPEDNPAPAWDARIRFQAVSHNGRLYVLGGGTGSGGNTLENDVWSWAEGESWTEVTGAAAWPARRAHQAVSHNGRLYVLGGGSASASTKSDDVWSSVDGANWSFEGNAAWSARIQHQAVSHNGRIYVLGGTDGTDSRNDVWSWAEGESWRREAANNNAFWSERTLFKALSHDGLLYVIDGSGYKSDVWSSADGVSWTEVTGSADWVGRRALQAVVFPPNLELPGSSETIILTLQVGLEIYTFSAQYGGGEYTYSLPLDPEGFNINGDGVLSANDEEVPAGIYLVTVRVEDGDRSQAESVINIELRSFALADAPALTAATALPATVKVHTFSAIYGVGAYTYAIASGNVGGYFSIGENSGELAVVNAAVGIYTLGVSVEDEVGSSTEAVATVAVKEFLALADVPLLGAAAASTMSIYTFIPAGLQGAAATYTLVAGNAAYFVVNPSSGVLSVVNAAAGFYTVTVEVSDGTDQAQVGGVVQVVLPVALVEFAVDTPKATMGAMLTVTTFSATDGFGAKRYAILSGNQAGYFAESGGALLLVGNDAMLAGNYTLSVEVTDSLVPPQRATAAVVVNILRNATAAQIMLMGGEDDSSQRLNDVWTSANGEIWESQPNADWSERTLFRAVFHNGRVYVMGGVDSTGNKNDVWSTTDGSSWVYEGDADWPARQGFVAMSYNGRIYVMGGNDGSFINDVWSSADGRSWVLEKANNSASSYTGHWSVRGFFDGMSHNGRIYVMGGWNGGSRLGDVWWSEDGQTWNEATSSAGWIRNAFSAASHNGRMYMTGGNTGPFNNDVWSSEDGTTWVREKENSDYVGWSKRDNHQVFSHDGLLYVVGGRLNGANDKANDIWSSADGKSWTEVTDEAAWPSRNIFDVAVGEGTFLVIVADQVVSFSPNYNGEIYQVSARFGFGKYTYSLEGTVGFTIDQNGIIEADGSHDAGQYTVTVRVEDAERLQSFAQIILDSDLLSLADASPQHIFTRLKNTVVLHTFAASGGGKPYTYNFASGNSLGYFTLDEKSGVLTFPANESATAGDYVLVVEVLDNLSGRETARIAVELDGGRRMFVLGGHDGTVYLDDVWSSPSGSSGDWTEETASAEWDPVGYAQTVPHKGLLYKIGGRAGSSSTSNSVWSSKDAKNWTRAGSVSGGIGRAGIQAASLNGRLYVAGGASTNTNYRRDVHSSGDGKSWVQETANANWPGREGHQMVAFNGRLYVMGGQTDGSTFVDDVWSSSNGRDWEFEGNADWSGRANHQAVVHQGQIYVVGGYDGANRLSDVWSSDDGKNWTEVFADGVPPWDKRSDHQALSHNNQLYVMSGDVDGADASDVWVLAGSTWVPFGNAPWSARVGFDAVVFPPRLALYGVRETFQLEQGEFGILHTMVAEYSFGALTYSLESDNTNIKLDNNGVLRTERNLSAGSIYTITVKVEDGEESEAQTEFRIQKNVFKVASAPPLRGYSKMAASQHLHTFSSSGGTAPYTYGILIGDEDFSINESNGALHLQAGDLKAGSYAIFVNVTDGIGFSQQTWATVKVVKNRMIVLSGYSQKSDAWESEDGISWRQRGGFDSRRLFPAVSHRGRVWAMGGYKQHSTGTQTGVSHSATGAGGWGSYNAPWAKRDSHDAASNGDTMYLMGGDGNKSDVWSTVNGSTWTVLSTVALPGRSDHQMVWHNGRLYVLGGDASGRKNDVWSSADGISWRFEGNADWVARERHQAFSYKGWIYVLGGISVDNFRLSDVWRSLDGRSWEQVKATGNQSWTERHLHGAFALDGRLYLMGGSANNNVGFPNDSRLSDVWSSEDDGVSWTLLGNAAWGGRMGFGALAYPPNLVVHGPTSDVITVSVGVTPDIMFTARDGYTAEPYTYALKPKMAGFNIDSDGALSVDDDAKGGFHRMTVLVTDGEGTQAETIVRVDVHALQIVDVPQLTAVVRLPVAVSLHTFSGAFGQGAYTYNLVGGNVAGYFALDAGGDLSLLQNDQMRGGTFDLLVEVSDSVPRQATAVVQVRLLPSRVYVLGGYDGTKQLNDVWSSFDNKTWHREVANAAWSARQDSQVVVYKGRLYVLGGHDGSNSLNDVWSSADGKNWSFVGTADWPARGEHQAVVYKGRLYVLGGYEGSNHPYLNDFTGSRLNDVWSSADGKSWSFEGNADWTARSGHATAVHNDVLYVLGGQPGFLNDEVWSSVDGQNWSFEGNGNWDVRRWFQAQSFNSRLYVLGGDAGGGRGDIWSSADGSSLGGKSWLEVRGSGSGVGWSDRGGHQALLYQDLMYVLGGSSFSNELNDVWSSGDGRNWTKVADAGWSKRDSHQAVTFPPSLALAGTNEHFILSVGVAESAIATVTAQHGFGDYTYSLAPGTGKGFTFDSNTRVLSNDGSSIRGSYWVTVQVTDEDGALAETVIRVDVHGLFMAAPPPILIYGAPPDLPAQELHTFVAAEGVEPYNYALKDIPGAGRDAQRFTINPTSGVLSVRANISPKTYNIGVEVTDGDGTKVQVNVQVIVRPVLSLTDAPTVNLFIDEIGTTVTVHTFAAGGGIGAKVYNIVTVNADGHFSLDANSGVLSAVGLTVGAYTLTVRVRDGRGSNVVAQAVVRILEPFLMSVPPLVFLTPKSMSVTLYNFTGGSIGEKQYLFSQGNFQGYFNLGRQSGILSVKPNTPAGTYPLVLLVIDSGAPGKDPVVHATVHLVDNGIFVLGGSDGGFRNDVWLASEGGVVWGAKTTDAGWPGRGFYQAVLHNERIYVMGGDGSNGRLNDVWSSADGITWEFHGNANWPRRAEHQAVEHNGKLYMMGGTNVNGFVPLRDVWSSADGGATWALVGNANWQARRLHQAVSHNGRIYVVGGYDGVNHRRDMWSTADGQNWVFDSDGDWQPRNRHKAVSHNGRIYIMGGWSNTYQRDVWSTADGIIWRQETAAAEWSGRHSLQAVSRNGLLYMMGGVDNSGRKNDMWSSADGRSWTIVTGNANWTAREQHQAVVMPRSFSLLGAPGRVALTANVAASNIHTFQGQDGAPAYTYSFLGSAPAGFSLGSSSGVLSVDDRLVVSVVYAVTVQVQDADGRRAQAEANIEALAPLSLVLLPGTDEILTVTSRIVRNIHTFRASQGSRGYSYSLKPVITGFAIGPNSGVLSTDGSLNPGIYTVIVQVDDKKGATPAQTSITVDVRGFKLLGFGTKVWGQGNEDPIHAFQTEYGVGPYSYSLDGGDSNWFQLKPNSRSNILHIKFGSSPLPPAKAYNIIVRVQDGRGLTSEVTVRVDVRAVALPAFSDVPLDGGRYYSDIANKDIKAQYGAPPYTYTLSPPVTGYSIDPISGALEATGEGALGTYTITVKVTDSKGKPATRGLVVRVRAPSASAARLISFPNNSIISPSALSHPPRVRHGELAPPPQVRGVRIIHHLPPREFAMVTSHPPTSAGDENYLSSHPPL